MLPSTMHRTWPSLLRRRLLGREYIEGTLSTRENVVVGYKVLPPDIQDTPQAARAEGVESMVLAHVGGPCLTAIKERMHVR